MSVFDDGHPIDDVCVIDSKDVKNGDFGVFKDTQMKDFHFDDGGYYQYLRIVSIRGFTTDDEVIVIEPDGSYSLYEASDFAVFFRFKVSGEFDD